MAGNIPARCSDCLQQRAAVQQAVGLSTPRHGHCLCGADKCCKPVYLPLHDLLAGLPTGCWLPHK
jgi:hypothetical protein